MCNAAHVQQLCMLLCWQLSTGVLVIRTLIPAAILLTLNCAISSELAWFGCDRSADF
jgi:hypothetical protein